MARSPRWDEEELLAALSLYLTLPFGKFDHRTPEVKEFALKLRRTENAIAMKLSNFAWHDPAQVQRLANGELHQKGLPNGGVTTKKIFKQFLDYPAEIASKSEEQYTRLMGDSFLLDEEGVIPELKTSTEATGMRPIRLMQNFFRKAVLQNYNFSCAVCGLNAIEALNASHIIPWKDAPARRTDPRNGLALCALHDRLFDRGLLGVKSNFQIQLSSSLSGSSEGDFFRVAIAPFEGQPLRLPSRFAPDPTALAFHEQNIFRL